MNDFTIQITPLLRPDSAFVETDFLVPTQFSDVGVHHVLNGFKTASVTLDMTDPVVEGLEPREFALRILYRDRLEPVFWGPCNIDDDYERGKCILNAQDPSFRLLHHYLRRGDDAINGVPEVDKGTITPDPRGIIAVLAAAENIAPQIARNDPDLGIIAYMSGPKYATEVNLPIIVQRGQECWQVITNISEHDVGPDFDMETPLTELDRYVNLATYDDLGRDLTTDITLTYGPQLTGVGINPGRGTTHAHVLSSDTKFRRTAGSVAASNKTGPHVDWVPTDLEFPDGDDSALQAKANDIVKAYAFAPKFITIKSRPDVALINNYGNPSFTPPAGTTPSTFYIGDRITVSAERGYRSFVGPVRITEVHLTQSGSRGNSITELKLVPTVGDLGDDEES